ncbi:tRNA dimethylallyltransferase [Oenococcus oeni]|uniref:tRNA (adenosine(37)-N6)-dimethylallyltransferase n=1 Tax=Oenococcus oeni TaxID=1247 RepID=UPI0008F90B58|nr:tRNA (adenosine(37)-N6)-dimethylallyltransferase MiaA [Oenococcus oeni]OIM23488.1 tRNA dimethylallyltransferase [Oenococcus oeni]
MSDPHLKEKVVVIAGPTASGKSDLAIKIAQMIDSEIISEDAFQIYRGLDIGTAKPSKDDLAKVKHHFIDIKEVDESYSAYEFARDARIVINQISSKKKIPLIVGGSGFFLQTLLGDRRIADKDNPIVPKKAGIENRLYNALLIGLNTERSQLYDRINQRVERMFEKGIVKEAENLFRQQGNFQSKKAIGYREFAGYFANQYDLSEVETLIKRDSRRYAKRQLTYFKNQFPDMRWFDTKQIAENPELIIDLVKKFNQF